MGRKILVFIIFLFFASSAFSQEVSNIITRQLGDKIEISYKIDNSTEQQLFFVSIYCSVDGKDRIKLTSVTGDVGDNIKGGQVAYKIIWDVLKDVDEVNSAEFFVKIELKEDGSKLTTISPLGQKKWVIGYNGSAYLPFGVRVSYLGNWGGYLGVRFGNVWNTYGGYVDYYKYASYQDYSNGDYLTDSIYTEYPYWDKDYSEFGFSVNAGVTKRLLSKKKYQLHAYAGIGYGYWGTYYSNERNEYDQWITTGLFEDGSYGNPDNGEFGYHEHVYDYSYSYIVWGNVDLEAGFYLSYQRLALNLGMAYSEQTLDIVFGLGYKF
jgi:hypothetical protein